MNIIILTHPDFQGSQSMPKYAKMIVEGMQARDHSVDVWTAKEYFYKFPLSEKFRKWLGYLDQFLIFPLVVKSKLNKVPSNTLFVFADQALGPWVPLVAKKYPHVIHCHDFLAQRSAIGEISENKVRLTGKIYQKWIRNGYQCGRNFISISQKTEEDLIKFLKISPGLSEIVYNGLNQDFTPGNPLEARLQIEQHLRIKVIDGYVLHVGGNQFYKNRKGVIKIYSTWRKKYNKKMPLLMVGPHPTAELTLLADASPYASDIHFASNISDKLLKLAYQGAAVLLFPSIEEGFGWPIAEAMASGTPVITTKKAPMTEVGGESCFYISPYPSNKNNLDEWYEDAASVLNTVMELSNQERQEICTAGIKNSERFNTDRSLKQIERIYSQILTTSKN